MSTGKKLARGFRHPAVSAGHGPSGAGSSDARAG